MNMKQIFLMSALVFSIFGVNSVQALTVKNTSTGASIEEAGKTVELSAVAEGLREKKVVLFWAKVYNAKLFTISGAKIDKSSGEAMLDSLSQNQAIALSLSFLRNVEAKKIVDGFKESLKENGVSADAEPYKTFMNEAQKQGEAKEGQTIWLVMKRVESAGKKEEQVTFYADGKPSFGVTAPADQLLIKHFLSIWLGKSADSGLEKLKEQFLK